MNKTKREPIVVGMSGGVDSSMSLLLLKKQGWSPVGLSLKYAVWQDKQNLLRENICCSSESFAIAKNICKKLNLPHHIFDVSDDFKQKVIYYFIKELKNCRTPNPCIICNRYLKFKKLFEWAKEHNIKYVATGHYACLGRNKKTGKYELKKAKDSEKDQTYSLAFLPQKWLKYIVFPLGDYKKQEVFQLAKKHGFGFYLKRKQSQDFCFVAGKCLNCFLKKEIGRKQGMIKDKEGSILGKHSGLHFYTIGQRKGLDLSGGPYFVIDKIRQNNTLVVSKNKRELERKEAVLSPYNLISGGRVGKEIRAWVKIRFQHTPARARLIPINLTKIKVIFDKPQKAITPGQFAVFYQAKSCLGGGKIINSPKAKS